MLEQTLLKLWISLHVTFHISLFRRTDESDCSLKYGQCEGSNRSTMLYFKRPISMLNLPRSAFDQSSDFVLS